jgi:2-dehydropantoate 2-reductase
VVLPITATDDWSALPAPDVVLIAVKTWQVEAVARQLPAVIGAQTRCLTLQNGVEAPGIVADQVGAARTLGGLVRGFFQLDAPGVVHHASVQPTIIFGQLEGSRSPEALALFDCLTAAGIYAECSDDIEAALWAKFLLVTALSGVGAVTREPIGAIRACDLTWGLLRDVMAEIAGVAHACGVDLSDGAVERTVAFVETFPPGATTSMQRDLMAGLPSELDAQTGAVVRLGREVGVAVPLNATIYASLVLQEQRAREAARARQS